MAKFEPCPDCVPDGMMLTTCPPQQPYSCDTCGGGNASLAPTREQLQPKPQPSPPVTSDVADLKQLTGRGKALVRLWDKDFNLLHSAEADTPGEALGQLFVTVDPADGGRRKGGRIASVTTEPGLPAWPIT